MNPEKKMSLGFAAAVLVVLAGATFKVMHWPYASELLFFGQIMGALCLIIWFARDKHDRKAEDAEHV